MLISYKNKLPTVTRGAEGTGPTMPSQGEMGHQKALGQLKTPS